MKTQRMWLMACALLPMLLIAARGDEDKIAYLGVGTAPVEPAVAAQVGLPEGVGVLVVNVAEDGVVKDKLAPYDILHKLNEHLLTSPAQFAELVRDHQPGDEIKLLILHQGKPETLKIRLGSIAPKQLTERGPPRLFTPPYAFRQPAPDRPANDAFAFGLRDLRRRMEQLERQWRDRLAPAEEADDDDDDAAAKAQPPTTPAPPHTSRAQRYQHSESMSVVTENRDGLSVTLTEHNGQRTVKAEENGKVIFEGPANTPAQLKAMPKQIRQRVEEMGKNIKIQIQPPAAGPVSGVPL
ncbi:MAG: PDZ domain-containing protein [Kiritimatiellaeota bacterium]|nr:PDZ domain-containing protein [Kiritimatiellota bacterium]